MDTREQQIEVKRQKRIVAPGGRDKERRVLRRIAGRLGLDFFVAGLKYATRQFGEYLRRARFPPLLFRADRFLLKPHRRGERKCLWIYNVPNRFCHFP